MSHMLEDLRKFLERSPTSWHAVQEIGSRLASIDFIPLEEGEAWTLEGGEKYFVLRGGSLAAFSIPKKKPTRARLLASHTDSPALKIKPLPEVVSEGMVFLETETYGSPIDTSWLCRDLAIAGRIVVERGKGEVEEQTIFLDEAPVIIPELPPHLKKDKAEKVDLQDHLRALFSLRETASISTLLQKQISGAKLLSFDLFLVPLEPVRFIGAEGELISSYRLDNLASVHACMAAIASAPINDTLQIALFLDHEEIGSRTAEGAASSFVSDLFRRIGSLLSLSEEEMIRMRTSSLGISVDVAHAYNPNHTKKYDPKHRLVPGKGIALKHHADKKYASDAKTSAELIQACTHLGLRYQQFAPHSDIPCGSTIGPILAQQTGIPTVDIGCPIFSMHAARETMACQDHLDLCALLTHLLSS